MLFSMSCHPWESIDATERPEIRHPKASDHSLIFREVSLNDNDNQSMAFENKCSTGMYFSSMLKMLLKPGCFIVLIFTGAESSSRTLCFPRTRDADKASSKTAQGCQALNEHGKSGTIFCSRKARRRQENSELVRGCTADQSTLVRVFW